MNAIDHHSSPEPQSLPPTIAREEEVGEQQDAAAEELRGHDAEHVERLAGQHEVAHEQAGAGVAERAEQRQDRADDDVLAARGVAGEDDHEHAGEADREAERRAGP